MFGTILFVGTVIAIAIVLLTALSMKADKLSKMTPEEMDTYIKEQELAKQRDSKIVSDLGDIIMVKVYNNEKGKMMIADLEAKGFKIVDTQYVDEWWMNSDQVHNLVQMKR